MQWKLAAERRPRLPLTEGETAFLMTTPQSRLRRASSPDKGSQGASRF